MKIRIKKRKLYNAVAILISIILLFTAVFAAEPDGATVYYKSNSTKNSSNPDSRNDTKGTITTIVIDAVQQDNKWKAYVGNVTGTLVLRDASDYSIYEWTSIGNPSGEVYITRNDSITWSNIKCANSTHISTEETALNHSSTAGDNIQNTFSSQAHKSFWVGDITEIANSTCYSTATWVNDTEQTITENSLYQEVVLYDDLNIIYATILEDDLSGYKNDTNTTYDFQSIVPDSALSGSSGQVTYYFYVEIESS
jgi:hypothetical protein